MPANISGRDEAVEKFAGNPLSYRSVIPNKTSSGSERI